VNAPSYGARESMDSAGTGYGSPARVVAFEPQSRPLERIYIKYEWHATLCRLGIIPPEPAVRHPRNRLWDNGGFAPPLAVARGRFTRFCLRNL
jgi:hypothetical protein